jgi:predicted dehydrogenase
MVNIMGKILNVGVIGAGTISSSHVRGFLKDGRARIDAVSDIYERHARMKAERWGAKKVYTDYKALLKDSEIDVVNICVTPNLHHEIGVAALEAGKHLLTEKPMALTLKDCDEMISAAKRNNVKLMVCHNQLFWPPHQVAKQLVENEIGRPIVLMSILHGGWPAHGWRGDPKIAGGVMMEAFIHRFYVSRYLMGEVKRVTCVLGRTAPHFKSEDVGCITLEFQNGSYGTITANVGGPSAVWDDRTEVVGDQGMVIVNGVQDQILQGPPLLHYKDGMWKNYCNERILDETIEDLKMGAEQVKFTTHELDTNFLNTFYYLVKQFIDCILQDKTPFVSGEEGRRIVEIILACYESAATGKAITV